MDNKMSKGKRKWNSTGNEPQDDRGEEPAASILLHHLPDASLRCVASFLPFKDKLMFAMALPTWNFTQTHDVSKAILGEGRVESIDFGELDDHISDPETKPGVYNAKTLTDADLNHILVSVDAVNNLKNLKLTHCVQIEGHGLESLRGSRVLEMIDLSLVPRNHYQNSEPGHFCLSLSVVLPILSSIIDTDECNLKYIQLHSSWYKQAGINDNFGQFVSRYNNLAIVCDNCRVNDLNRGAHLARNAWEQDSQVGFEGRTCYECTQHFCYLCNLNLVPNNSRGIKPCLYCKRCTCGACCHSSKCARCARWICAGCEQYLRCKDCWVCCYVECASCPAELCGCAGRVCVNCPSYNCDDCSVALSEEFSVVGEGLCKTCLHNSNQERGQA